MRRRSASIVVGALLVTIAGCEFNVTGFALTSSDGALSFSDAASDLPPSDFAPSHVSSSTVIPGAASLTHLHDIDTDNFEIDGQPPPAGIVFAAELTDAALAVLSVKDFSIVSDVTVHGSRGLVIVATDTIQIGATMYGGAQLRTPGPGGQFTGAGHGSDGKDNNGGGSDSGGGGAGYGTTGGNGGDTTTHQNNEGGAGGPAFSDYLAGGSGGGNGASKFTTCPSNATASLGGTGGGIIQLSAAVSLTVLESGDIDVGGGGGGAGCSETTSAGGGGGSGGSLWLEAPTMNLGGRLTANGGGGGSGARFGGSGANGQNGHMDASGAAGGNSEGTGSGAGGSGGALAIVPVAGMAQTNAGGGGGAVGRIRLRTRDASPVMGAATIISPAAYGTVDF